MNRELQDVTLLLADMAARANVECPAVTLTFPTYHDMHAFQMTLKRDLMPGEVLLRDFDQLTINGVRINTVTTEKRAW